MLEKTSAPGIHDETEKRALADSWLELAVSFTKVPKYEADILKQQQKQEQAIPQQEIG